MAAPGIAALLQQLRSRQRTQQLSAAIALCNLADNKATNDAIAAAGGVCTLLGLLNSRSEAVQEAAAGALCNLAHTGELSRRAIVDAGGIEALVGALSVSRNPQVQLGAVRALRHLVLASGLPDAKSRLVAAGGIAAMAQLMRGSQCNKAVYEAAWVLNTTVSGSKANRTAAAAAGSVPTLVALASAPHEICSWQEF